MTCPLNKVENYQRNGSIQVGGMVSMSRHMISKNGNGWGIFAIQDYQGTLEFKLFGDDYEKFQHLLKEGKAIFVKGGFQKSWRGDGMDFKPKEISLLEGIGESLTQSITLKLPLEKLTEKLIDNIETLCNSHKGKHRLKMELIDRTNRLTLHMKAKERTVLADTDFHCRNWIVWGLGIR